MATCCPDRLSFHTEPGLYAWSPVGQQGVLFPLWEGGAFSVPDSTGESHPPSGQKRPAPAGQGTGSRHTGGCTPPGPGTAPSAAPGRPTRRKPASPAPEPGNTAERWHPSLFPPLGDSLPGAKIRHSCIILVLAGHPSSISIQQRRMRDACCFL